MPTNSTTSPGLLVINKPVGPTSHDIVAQLRRQLAIQRIGHTGTLDPFASGVLLVAVGQATRLTEYAHDFSKTYETAITLGTVSTTDDPTGILTPHSPSTIPALTEVQKILTAFTGTIQQRPPHYAAVKIKGKKLYEYARAGQKVVAPTRQVTIHEIALQHYQYPHLSLRVHCSTGTYIRALARDIGEALGTGGYAESLRRIAIGPFTLAQAIAPEHLSQSNLSECLLLPHSLVQHLPSLILVPSDLTRFCQGQSVLIPSGVPSNARLVVILATQENIVGIARVDSIQGVLWPEKIVSVAGPIL